jgi:hypothetical protein
MDLRQALAQVSEIRELLARTEVYRGYRSLTVGMSGIVGLVAASIQAMWLPRPTERVDAYLILWVAAATISLFVVGVEIGVRVRQTHLALVRRTTIFAIEQFLPCRCCLALVFLLHVACCPVRSLLRDSGT